MSCSRIASGVAAFALVLSLGGGAGGAERNPPNRSAAELAVAHPAAATDTLFRDVTSAALPKSATSGAHMDADVGDIDADGDLDVVVACEFCRNLLWLNQGDGTFVDGSDQLPRTTHDSEDITIVDVDADGDLDLVFVTEDDLVNELFLNDGKGLFKDASGRITETGITNALAVADLNNDGAPDLVLGNQGANMILVNDGDGFFTSEPDRLPGSSGTTQDVELGDVDGDGDLDLLEGNEDGNRLWINDGAGFFRDLTTARLPGRSDEETREADFGDVDGDGDLDIYFSNVELFVEGVSGTNRLLLNDGAGFFAESAARQIVPDDNGSSYDADLVDIDGDSDMDLVIGYAAVPDVGAPSNSDVSVRVMVNDGRGNFVDGTSATVGLFDDANPFDLEVADFTGDGIADLLVISRRGPDKLFHGVASAGTLPCAQIRKVAARCVGGDALVTVKLRSKDYHGGFAQIGLGDVAGYLEIKRKRARGRLQLEPGSQQVRFWGPASCRPARLLTCTNR